MDYDEAKLGWETQLSYNQWLREGWVVELANAHDLVR